MFCDTRVERGHSSRQLSDQYACEHAIVSKFGLDLLRGEVGGSHIRVRSTSADEDFDENDAAWEGAQVISNSWAGVRLDSHRTRQACSLTRSSGLLR